MAVTERAKERDQKRTMAATWAMSLFALEEFPASAALLRLSAFLAPGPIPFELLATKKKSIPEPLLSKIRQLNKAPQILDELLKPLQRLSLIRRSDETRSYSLHPLVQEVVREGLSKKAQTTWAKRAVRMVNDVFPDPEKFENWPSCDRFLPHALACAGLIKLHGLEFKAATDLLDKAGWYLDDRAEYANAEVLYRQALGIYKNTVGPNHHDTAASLNNLGLLYQNQGRHKEAEPLLRRALAISKRDVGPEHPDIAANLNNLAMVYHDEGRYKDAARLYRRALAIHEKTQGPKHPDFAYSLNNLGELYRTQGRDKEAEPLQRRALAIREKALGPEHPETATSLNNLALLLDTQGKPAEAEPLYRRALTIREKALGVAHPWTAVTRNNLIRFFREQGRGAEADALEKAAKGKAE